MLRTWRPDLVLSPTPHDRHPDHGRAHRLVEAAAYYAGLAGRAPNRGPVPHRPAVVFSYMQHDAFEPSFVVDVSADWATKVEALRAYRSQLNVAPEEQGGDKPATKVSSREFWHAVEGRARHFGLMINAEMGEPFWSRLPLAVGNPMSILPGGIR